MSDYSGGERDFYDDVDYEPEKSRSRSPSDRSRNRSSSSSDSYDSESSSSNSRSRSPRNRRRGRSRTRRSRSAQPKRRARAASASPVPGDDDRDKIPLQDLRTFVAKAIQDQSDDIDSKIDQKRVRAAARAEYGARSLVDAYIPNSRVKGDTREHVLGCPCEICVNLHHTLDAADKERVEIVRGMRNWVIKGGRRALCLLIPAAPPSNNEMQPPPLAFCGPLKTLLQLEKAYASRVSLHPLLCSGLAANSSPVLSTRWTGGSSNDLPIKRQMESGAAAGSSRDLDAPQLDTSTHYSKDGPVSYGRYDIKEKVEKPPKFVASREAMDKARDLFALGRPSLEKAVKEYKDEVLAMSTPQYGKLKTPPMPIKIHSAVTMDAPTKARENALVAVGGSLSYAVVASVKMSEVIASLDEVIPLTELHSSTVVNANEAIPVYIPPSEIKRSAEIVASPRPSQKHYVDPATTDEAKIHYLRAKGDKMLSASSVLKDIYVAATPDVDTQLVGPVAREAYDEVCWRAVLLRDVVKKLESHNALVTKRLNDLNTVLADQLFPTVRLAQEVFARGIYPAVALTRSQLMFQRLDHFRSMLTPEFREFAKKKTDEGELLTDGSKKTIMQLLVEDPEGLIAEFSEYSSKHTKHKEIFIKKKNVPEEASGSGRSRRTEGYRHHHNNNNRDYNGRGRGSYRNGPKRKKRRKPRRRSRSPRYSSDEEGRRNSRRNRNGGGKRSRQDRDDDEDFGSSRRQKRSRQDREDENDARRDRDKPRKNGGGGGKGASNKRNKGSRKVSGIYSAAGQGPSIFFHDTFSREVAKFSLEHK